MMLRAIDTLATKALQQTWSAMLAIARSVVLDSVGVYLLHVSEHGLVGAVDALPDASQDLLHPHFLLLRNPGIVVRDVQAAHALLIRHHVSEAENLPSRQHVNSCSEHPNLDTPSYTGCYTREAWDMAVRLFWSSLAQGQPVYTLKVSLYV